MSKESRIGLQMYTMRNVLETPEEYRATCKRIAEIGYEVIQVKPPQFFSDEEFKAMIDECGLWADSVFAPTGHVCEQIDRAKKQAELFGCDVLRTNSIPSELRSNADGYRRYAEILNQEGEACKKAGLRYIYHFHAFEWVTFGKERGIDILLNETDPTCVYFQPDVFWLTSAGTEPSNSLRMFEGRAFSMHVKDYAIQQLEGAIESVPFHFASVGEGNLNWPGILKTANEIGIQRFVVEQDACKGDVFEAIQTSYQALRGMGLQ